MKRALWIGAGLTLLSTNINLFAKERVYIRGSKKEKYHRDKGGRATLIKPGSPSRMNPEILLSEDPSMVVSKDDQIRSTGFVIPSVRGQDSKLTDISLGNLLIYDPLSSLPLFNEPDLMAFGQLEIYHGVTPWNLPGSSPTGHIRYDMPSMTQNRSHAGIQAGKPFGHSLWLKQQGSQEFEHLDFSYSLFGRTHQSNGRFNYYDDKGNPWVPRDGETASRENNDSRTQLFMPWIRLESKSQILDLVVLSLRRKNGTPGYGRRLSSGRQKTRADLVGLSWSYHFSRGSVISPDRLDVTGMIRKDEHELDDPNHPVTKKAFRQGTGVFTHEEGLRLVWDKDRMQSSLGIQKGVAELNQNQDGQEKSKYQRHHIQGTGGVRLVHFDWLNSEIKGGARKQTDVSDQANELYKILSEDESRERERSGFYKNASYSLYGSTGSLGYYVQTAWTQRPPGLWEFFGDSAHILPNLSLKAEKIRHHELGSWYRFKEPDIRIFASIFRDQMDDKIFFLPSYAGTYRAQNLRKTRISGIEAGGDWSLSCGLYSTLSLTALNPVWVTSDKETKLPGVAEKQGVFTIGYDWQKKLNFRLSTKFQGRKFLDEDNSQAVNSVQTWDSGLDYQLKLFESIFYAGISVTNLTDQKYMDIYSAQNPGQKGRTGLSDTPGIPAPGRQWVLSVSGEW